MPRTKTFHNPTISLPSGGTLTFPQPPATGSRTSIYFPPGSNFDSALHWHESYTEYFRITQGVMRVVLEDSSRVLQPYFIGAGSGIVEVPKARRHRLRRGDSGGKWKPWMNDVQFKEGGSIPKEVWEMEVKGQEWTEPGDGRKEAFFRNLGGVVSEPGDGGLWSNLMVMLGVYCVMREFDNWPAFLGGKFRSLEWVLSHFVLLVASLVGGFVGLRGEWDEYTPVELRRADGKGKKGL